eukprot:5978662-Pyramimonas_sp.AAC.1
MAGVHPSPVTCPPVHAANGAGRLRIEPVYPSARESSSAMSSPQDLLRNATDRGERRRQPMMPATGDWLAD